ncbi:MAG: efflux transporter outer membrane subunit [Acidobacteriaceae bacterium]|nr:efflux transporter outer membrane subunit [Acidobacteriaceae bacterium]
MKAPYSAKCSVVALAAALSACSLIPDYERPVAPVSQTWPTGPAYNTSALSPAANQTSPAETGWREFFTDSETQELIELALKNNRDLRVAALNIEEAEATIQVQRSALLPTIDATASSTTERYPADLSTTGRPSISRSTSAGLGFTSFELDLFGRIRSLSEQDLEKYLSQTETMRSTQISLVAEVVDAYLAWLSDRELLKLTEDTLKSQRESYELTRLTTQHGTGTALDLAQAETSVRTAEANQAQYTRQVAQDWNALVLLLGEQPSAALQARMMTVPGLDAQNHLPTLQAGLPSDLLQRRPDIMAAEHTLKAANANIGAARAAFFPTITLTANAGTASAGLSRLFAAGQANWVFSPQISIPIFDYGKNSANLDIAKIEERIEIAQYEKAIQTAFREVADSLAALDTYQRQLAAQQALVLADDTDYKLSEMRFRTGIDNYLSTLIAQRSLYSAQITLIGVHLAQLENLVTFYKVLGGGWVEHTADGKKNN